MPGVVSKAALQRLQTVARHSRSMIKRLRQTYISPYAYKPLDTTIPRKPMKRLLRKTDSVVKDTVKK